jgi:hypothetical protein
MTLQHYGKSTSGVFSAYLNFRSIALLQQRGGGGPC